MAYSRIYRFTLAEEVEAFVNGCVVVKTPAPRIFNIVGKSLVFAQPSATTVTFAEEEGMGSDLTPAQAYKQLRTAIPALITRQTVLGVLLMENDPNLGVEITSDSDEEALRAFGLGKEGSKGVVYTPSAVSSDPPSFSAIQGGQGQYEILVYVDGPAVPDAE